MKHYLKYSVVASIHDKAAQLSSLQQIYYLYWCMNLTLNPWKHCDQMHMTNNMMVVSIAYYSLCDVANVTQ